MTEPVRIQLSRRKGFNLQAVSLATNGLPGINVARPTKWGNPWSIRCGSWWFVDGPGAPIGGLRCANQEGARLVAVNSFRLFFEAKPDAVTKLRGKNLACWCKPGLPCHADVLKRAVVRGGDVTMSRAITLPDRASVTIETALRLDVAAALAYPDGSMTASGLRRERDAERLETWFTAGKEYTSLAAIEEMVKKCRAMRKVRASGSSPRDSTNDAACETRPSGSSETEAESLALAAALMRCQPQRTPSADISSTSTIRPLRRERSPATH